MFSLLCSPTRINLHLTCQLVYIQFKWKQVFIDFDRLNFVPLHPFNVGISFRQVKTSDHLESSPRTSSRFDSVSYSYSYSYILDSPQASIYRFFSFHWQIQDLQTEKEQMDWNRKFDCRWLFRTHRPNLTMRNRYQIEFVASEKNISSGFGVTKWFLHAHRVGILPWTEMSVRLKYNRLKRNTLLADWIYTY